MRRNSPFSWHLNRKSESQEAQDKSMDKQILQRAVRKFVVICLLHFQIVEQFARWSSVVCWKTLR